MKVKLSPYPHHLGIKTEVDGHELPEVRAISLRCDVGDIPVLTVDMNAHDDLDVELDAQVVIRVIPLYVGQRIEIEQVSETKQIFRVVKDV